MKKNIFADIKKDFPDIQKNISLKEYTTFRVGGKAKYFFVAKNKNILPLFLATVKKYKLPILIFGGGSNILVSDKGFNGLAIKIENKEMEFSGDKVLVGAGVALSRFANIASKNGFSGFEWAVGIPSATVGGSIYGNAQAFGNKISDFVESVDVFDLKTLKIKKINKQQCKFSLKNSIFKKNKNLIIISIIFNLQKGDNIQIKKNINNFLKHRKNCHPMNFASAGSVFVNPEVKIKNKKLLEKFPELSEFNKMSTIPSAYLIEKAGLKGKKIGKAQISEKHANFIVNLGGAKTKDILSLIKLAQKQVKNIFKINLKIEVQII